MTNVFFGSASIALVALSLTACGGGGGGGGGDDAPAAPALTTPWDASHLVAINAHQVDRSMAGQGVTVAVVDTGFQAQHDEFPGSPMLTVVNGGDHESGFRDHGTGVASMLGGINLGVAPQAQMILFNAGTADAGAPAGASTSTQAAEAINAARSSDPGVIETSASLDDVSAIRDAVQAATDANIVVVIPAGNDGTGLADFAAEAGQARYSGAVIVSGNFNRRTGDLAQNSNIATIEGSSEIHPAYLSAPASFVCVADDQTGSVGSEISTCGAPAAPGADGSVAGYRYTGGTSYAAPQIAGAAALIRQARPDLTAAEVVSILLNSASDLGDPGYDGIYGAGLLNVAAALDLAAAAP